MLKAVLDTLDGLDEATRALYKAETDGKCYLQVEGADSLPAVRGLVSTLRKFKEVAPDANGLKERLDAAKNAETEVTTLKEQLAEAEKKGGGDRVKERERLEAQHKVEIEKKKTELANRDRFIQKLTVDSALAEGIEKAGVKPEFRSAVRAMLRERKPEVVAEGEGYRGIFRTDLGDIPITEYVQNWAKSDEATAYLPPSGKQGSGAPGAPGGGGKGGKEIVRLERGMIVADPEKVLKGEVTVAAE